MGIDEVMQEVSWHEVIGKRMKAARDMLRDADSIVQMIVFLIACEVLQFYNQWMFRMGRAARNILHVSPIMDLINFAYSPITLVRQYLSNVLRGIVARIWLCILMQIK